MLKVHKQNVIFSVFCNRQFLPRVVIRSVIVFLFIAVSHRSSYHKVFQKTYTPLLQGCCVFLSCSQSLQKRCLQCTYCGKPLGQAFILRYFLLSEIYVMTFQEHFQSIYSSRITLFCGDQNKRPKSRNTSCLVGGISHLNSVAARDQRNLAIIRCQCLGFLVKIHRIFFTLTFLSHRMPRLLSRSTEK